MRTLDATDKDVSIGGAGLAAAAIELGLVEELCFSLGTVHPNAPSRSRKRTNLRRCLWLLDVQNRAVPQGSYPVTSPS